MRYATILWACGLVVAFPAVSSAEEGAVDPGRLYAEALLREVGHGKVKDALELYERVIRQYKAARVFAARALYRIGVCMRKLGKPDRAHETMRQVLKAFGDQEEVRRLAELELGMLHGHGKRAGRAEEERVRDVEKEVHRRLEELERRLKEKGIKGDELEKRIDAARKELIEQHRRHALRDESARARKEKIERTIKERLVRLGRQLQEKGLRGEELERRMHAARKELIEHYRRHTRLIETARARKAVEVEELRMTLIEQSRVIRDLKEQIEKLRQTRR